MKSFRITYFVTLLLFGILLSQLSLSARPSVADKVASRKRFDSRKINGLSYEHFIDQRSVIVIAAEEISGFGSKLNGQLDVLGSDGASTDFITGTASAISRDGYFLTAAHVLGQSHYEGHWVFQYRHHGLWKAPFRVVHVFEEWDIAILKAEWSGERFEFGEPLRYEHFTTLSVGLSGGDAAGHIVEVLPLDASEGSYRVYHRTPLMGGDSGGALVSHRGELLGINVSYQEVPLKRYFSADRSLAISLSPELIMRKVEEDRRLKE